MSGRSGPCASMSCSNGWGPGTIHPPRVINDLMPLATDASEPRVTDFAILPAQTARRTPAPTTRLLDLLTRPIHIRSMVEGCSGMHSTIALVAIGMLLGCGTVSRDFSGGSILHEVIAKSMDHACRMNSESKLATGHFERSMGERTFMRRSAHLSALVCLTG